MKKTILIAALLINSVAGIAQSQITTTGNNTINPSNPYQADIVIGSDANGGTRHDASMMWWSYGSANRISSTDQNFNFSAWSSNNPNASISANVGGTSYFLGNIGIGTASPTRSLSIQSTNSYLSFNNSSTEKWVLGNEGTANDRFIIYGGTTPNYRFSILNNGNVGIGTTSPSDPVNGNVGTVLDVNSPGSNNSIVVLHTGGTSNSGGGVFSVQSNLPVNGSPFIGQIAFQRAADITPGRISGAVQFALNNDGNILIPMTILSTGKIGIGTTNPDQKLSVAGTIHSQAVKVDLNGWSDYVFKPRYNLPSLSNVKSFIEKNGHLPGIPSEKEIVKNGVDLGEIVKMQQQKIEELTLYLIEQDKKLKTLKKQFSAFKNKVR